MEPVYFVYVMKFTLFRIKGPAEYKMAIIITILKPSLQKLALKETKLSREGKKEKHPNFNVLEKNIFTALICIDYAPSNIFFHLYFCDSQFFNCGHKTDNVLRFST